MNILGISCYYHDAAACLVRDGLVVAAAEEERFTRKKHDSGFPYNAIAYCLKAGGLAPSDLNAVGFYEKMGYVAKGDEFTEVSIPHYEMEKRL